MTWPTATAAKVVRHFSNAPYLESNRKFMAHQFLSLIPSLGAARFDYPRALLVRVQRAIDSNEDLSGRSAFFIPRQTYDYLIEYFDRANQEAFEVLKLWTSVLPDLLAGNDSAARASLRANVQQENDELTRQNGQIVGQINDASRQSQILDNKLTGSVSPKFEAEHSRLDACLDQQADKQKKKDQLVGVVKIAALVGTAATAVFCPPAAPFVAGGLSVGQAMIERGSVNNVNDVIQIANQAKNYSDDYQAKAKVLNQAVKDLWTAQHEGKYADLGDKLSDASEKLKDVVDWLKVATAPPDVDKTSTSILQGCDTSDLAAITNESSSIQNEIGKLQASIVELNRQMVRNSSVFDLNIKKLGALNIEKPQNDREVVEAEQIALTVWDEILARLSAVAPDLGRSFSYFSGDPFSFSPILNQMQSLYMDRYDTLRTLRKENPKDDVITLSALQTAAAARYLVYKNQLLSLKYSRKALGERLFPSSGVEYDFHVNDAGVFSFLKHRQHSDLISRINQEMARQVRAISGGELTPHQLIKLPPELISTADTMGRWAQLDDIMAKAVRMSRKRDTKEFSITLTFLHQAFGNVCNSTKCYFVDLRDESAEVNWIAFTAAVSREGKVNQSTKVGGEYVKPPLSSPLFLEVSVSPRKQLDGVILHSSQPPRLRSITVVIRSVERR
jgi:hypothetical protein